MHGILVHAKFCSLDKNKLFEKIFKLQYALKNQQDIFLRRYFEQKLHISIQSIRITKKYKPLQTYRSFVGRVSISKPYTREANHREKSVFA